MCTCFDRDPAWQGWEAWYFGHDETWEAAPSVDTERHVLERRVADAAPEPALLH